MTTYYIAQERALSPGIVTDWPETIPHPTDPNGRLVRFDKAPSLDKGRVKTLPKWAQKIILFLETSHEAQAASLKWEIARLRRIHALTADDRDWFTLGQANQAVATLETPAALFMAKDSQIVQVAPLGKGDCLLVARHKDSDDETDSECD